jgi:hypothetical protein
VRRAALVAGQCASLATLGLRSTDGACKGQRSAQTFPCVWSRAGALGKTMLALFPSHFSLRQSFEDGVEQMVERKVVRIGDGHLLWRGA